MDSNTRDSWFNGISPPDERGSRNNSGYLDRLMGNQSGPIKKQILRDNYKGKNDPKKSCHKTPPKYIKANPTPKTALVEVDDLQWLEERRKKFPRANDINRSIEKPSLAIDSEKSDSNAVESSPKPNDNDPSSRKVKSPTKAVQRKKTLFEKLMESSE